MRRGYWAAGRRPWGPGRSDGGWRTPRQEKQQQEDTEEAAAATRPPPRAHVQRVGRGGPLVGPRVRGASHGWLYRDTEHYADRADRHGGGCPCSRRSFSAPTARLPRRAPPAASHHPAPPIPAPSALGGVSPARPLSSL
ncbi:hypothetical protein Pcinc_043295 [Petrolisthes cinctipes]|uniref:Uncharacterized protein n=1 Tax=Petrolisthes cinctipes TaxID=88211 RepID=A0AAE1EF74_PETCI|nr:hypothetical protein Pcinc_043295 [Petrolisthes cinctipes]